MIQSILILAIVAFSGGYLLTRALRAARRTRRAMEPGCGADCGCSGEK